MKKLILFFLIFCSIYSYGEELTPEQQKTAWKFIYDKMFWNESYQKHDYPNIFKEDININLEGSITAEDSIYVQNRIDGIGKAIPSISIGMSAAPGNLIINLIGGSRKEVAVSINRMGGRLSHMSAFPDSLSTIQKEKLLYFNLFQGLVGFRYVSNPVAELKGSVYNVNRFDSVSFSPYDLFILEKLYSPDFSMQLAQNLETDVKYTAWNLIRDKFMGETKSPIIYRDDIAICLKGDVSSRDSLIVNEIIDQLRLIIPNRKILLTDKAPNLILSFDSSNSPAGTYSKTVVGAIKFHEITIKDKTSDYFGRDQIVTTRNHQLRKKYIYHSLVQALVEFSSSKTDQTKIAGCVFDESSPEEITYHPFDAFILNALYADDFSKQFKEQYIRQYSYRSYLVFMYQHQLQAVFLLLAIILCGILLIRLILREFFKPHNWKWNEYNKQGMVLAGIVALFVYINSSSDLQFSIRPLTLAFYILQAFFSINLIFLIERSVFKKLEFGGEKVIIIFLVTFVILSSFFVTSFIALSAETEPGTVIVSSQLSLSIIIAISLGRSIYIFLNDRYRSIIRKKDLELAKLNEQHKQAELQSLRAKINPHFLYNSLNSIASLATTDAKKTEQMALALSDFFKYSINREHKQFNSLSEELRAVQTYLEIEKVRFGDRLNFKIDCPAELLECQIPQFLIQPLVENSIKHGLSHLTTSGEIRIVAERAKSLLKIRIYDNGPAFPDGPLSGFGIQNTQERIGLLYGDNASVNWQNEPEKFIEISMPLNK